MHLTAVEEVRPVGGRVEAVRVGQHEDDGREDRRGNRVLLRVLGVPAVHVGAVGGGGHPLPVEGLWRRTLHVPRSEARGPLPGRATQS